MGRAIGRICGKDGTLNLSMTFLLLSFIGKTKFAIEHSTKTRLVIADQKIHILGAFNNVCAVRDLAVYLLTDV